MDIFWLGLNVYNDMTVFFVNIFRFTGFCIVHSHFLLFI